MKSRLKIIGWLIAKAVRFAVVRTLRALNFNVITDKAGIDAFLRQGGGDIDTIAVMGALAYWLVILAAMMVAFNSLDLAYVTWAPNAQLKLTAGKQRYPWQRTGAFFYDNDVNPEGIAVNYATGNFFASTFYDWLAERALSFGNVTTGTNTDSVMYGAQVGYRFPINDSTRLTAAATYLNFDGVQGYNPFFGGSSFGQKPSSF